MNFTQAGRQLDRSAYDEGASTRLAGLHMLHPCIAELYLRLDSLGPRCLWR